ncbi:ATP-dependent DNA ligase [Herbiconiux sp. VKM Ac-2851]|nr:ATP-dependent DNA ligase [Herbiconiux sp. VKM Ac-2851]
MGSFIYDGTTVQFEDRLLTHLQIVIIQKFQRQESFLMSWKDSPNIGDGRAAIWLTPNIPIYFKFLGSRLPEINREWLAKLAESSDSSSGLIVVGEDGKLATSVDNGKYPGSLS